MFVRFNNSNSPLPIRATSGSVGYDLHITGIKSQTDNVYYCHTGWTVRPPKGHYAVIHPRSSLPKSNLMLANSTGIIDVDYQGELIVALTVIGDKSEFKFPELPFRAVQVVFNKIPYMGDVQYLDNIDEEKTARGEGGFGSTNNMEANNMEVDDKEKRERIEKRKNLLDRIDKHIAIINKAIPENK